MSDRMPPLRDSVAFLGLLLTLGLAWTTCAQAAPSETSPSEEAGLGSDGVASVVSLGGVGCPDSPEHARCLHAGGVIGCCVANLDGSQVLVVYPTLDPPPERELSVSPLILDASFSRGPCGEPLEVWDSAVFFPRPLHECVQPPREVRSLSRPHCSPMLPVDCVCYRVIPSVGPLETLGPTTRSLIVGPVEAPGQATLRLPPEVPSQPRLGVLLALAIREEAATSTIVAGDPDDPSRRGERARCPLCHSDEDVFAERVYSCSSCAVRYHQACAEELGGCGTLGCARMGLGPRDATPRQRVRLDWRVLLIWRWFA